MMSLVFISASMYLTLSGRVLTESSNSGENMAIVYHRQF